MTDRPRLSIDQVPKHTAEHPKYVGPNLSLFYSQGKIRKLAVFGQGFTVTVKTIKLHCKSQPFQQQEQLLSLAQ